MTRKYPQRRQPRGKSQLLAIMPLPFTDEEMRLMRIVQVYFKRLMVAESQLCTATYKDLPFPANEIEKRRIEENAEWTIYDLCEKNGLTRMNLLEAIRKYARIITREV